MPSYHVLLAALVASGPTETVKEAPQILVSAEALMDDIVISARQQATRIRPRPIRSNDNDYSKATSELVEGRKPSPEIDAATDQLIAAEEARAGQ